MNQVEYSQKSVQYVAAPKNMAFLAPITSNGSNSYATNASYFNSASANSAQAPQSNEKATMVGDAQALKISTEHVALFNTFIRSYGALTSGELKREVFIAKEMYQVDPDDMEEMDMK
ncbi:hypothetical protein Hanom_Chr05g00410561 [Helianthus anomalus]